MPLVPVRKCKFWQAALASCLELTPHPEKASPKPPRLATACSGCDRRAFATALMRSAGSLVVGRSSGYSAGRQGLVSAVVLFCVQVPGASSLVSTRLCRKLPSALLKPCLDRMPVAREPGTPRTSKHAVLHLRPTRTTPKVRFPVRLSAGAGVFRCKSYRQQLRQHKAGHVLGPTPEEESAVSCKSYQQRHASLQPEHPAGAPCASKPRVSACPS